MSDSFLEWLEEEERKANEKYERYEVGKWTEGGYNRLHLFICEAIKRYKMTRREM